MDGKEVGGGGGETAKLSQKPQRSRWVGRGEWQESPQRGHLVDRARYHFPSLTLDAGHCCPIAPRLDQP